MRSIKAERTLAAQRSSVWAVLADRIYSAVVRFLETVYRHHGPQGVLARAWPTGSMAFWATLLLGVYLVAYFI